MAQVKPANKKKMTKASLIATVVSVVILVAFAFTLVSSTGLFARMTNGASSDNFEINGAMIDYFAQVALQNWYNGEYMEEMYNTYGDYYQLFLQYGLGPFNPNVAYDEQVYDALTGKTYADLFVEKAEAHVARILNLCEAAKADSKVNFAELQAEAEEYAESSIATLEETAKKNNTTLPVYISAYYGANMNENDLKNCLVLEHLASDYATIVYDRYYDNMTAEEKEEFFLDNIGSFFTAGYLVYTVSNPETVEFPVAEDYEGGEESKAYKAAKTAAETNKTDAPNAEDYVGGANSKAYQTAYAAAEAAKAANEAQKAIDMEIINKLGNAKTAEEFKAIIVESEYSDAFDAAYDAILSKLGESKPTDDELAQFKATIKNQVIEAVLAGKTDIEAEKVENENATEWEKQQGTLPATVITKLTSTLTSATQTTTFSITSSLGQKLFGGVKAEYGVEYKPYEVQGTNAQVGDVWTENTMESNKGSIEKAIEIYEDMLKDEENDADEIKASIETLKKSLNDAKDEIANTSKTGHYAYSAFFVTEAAHREEAKVRDVGHILYQVDSSITTNTATTFKTSDEAKVAAVAVYEELKSKAVDGVVTKELFEEYATGKTADSSVFYEDVYTGKMVAEFEDWLFSAEKVGEIGLVETSYGWHIMYYGGEGEEATWEYLAHLAAANQNYADWEAELNHAVDVNTDLLVDFFHQ